MNGTLQAGSALESMLGLAAADFVRHYWNQTHCLSRWGASNLFAALGGSWSTPEWHRATETAYQFPRSPRVLAGEMGKRNSEGKRSSVTIVLEPNQVAAAVEMGATVIGDALDPHLSVIGAALKNELRLPGPITTYSAMSPRGEAAPLHYDPFHVFVFQVEGRKRWRLSRQRVVENPSIGRSIAEDGTINDRSLEDETVERADIGAMHSVVLEPGDVLYVPAGMAHATEALERSFSLMINFTAPRLDSLIEAIVRRALSLDPRWRGLPAAGPVEAHADHVNEGLSRVRGLLAGMDARSPEVAAAWDQMTANMGDFQNSYAASFNPTPLPAIDPRQRMRLTRRFPVRFSESRNADGELAVTVYLGQDQIKDTGAGAEFLRDVVLRADFNAEDARHWTGEPYDWEIVQSYLERLVAQGLLTAA